MSVYIEHKTINNIATYQFSCSFRQAVVICSTRGCYAKVEKFVDWLHWDMTIYRLAIEVHKKASGSESFELFFGRL